jgi:hypothetical protein
MFMRIAAGRKEREIDPAVAALKSCTANAARDPGVGEVAQARLKAMLDFVNMMDGFYAQMLTVERTKLATLVRLGAKVFSLLPVGKKKT